MLNVNETITFIKPCYKMRCFTPKIWRYAESPYLCNVFFIVLDLRLTKRLAVWEDSLFLCPHTTYIQPSSLDIHIKKSATDKIALFLIWISD